MDFNTFKDLVIDRCRELGISEYELYYQTAESTSISAFQHEINEFSSSTEGGVCFRCIVGGKMGYASTEELSAEQAASIVARAADNASVLEAEEPVFLGEGGKTYTSLEREPYALPAADTLLGRVLDAQERLYAADDRVIDGCQTQGIAERTEIAICNSNGLDLHSVTTLSGLVLSAVVSDGTEVSDNYEIKLAELSAIDADALAKKAVETAVRKLGGDVAPTGQYPVVFSPEAMSDLLSTFSSIFSSENAQKGLSRLAGQEGELIASPEVTLVDDPFCSASPVQRSFDAEGSPTFCKNVIEAGRFQTLLYNLKTAAVAGKQTTGNASKRSYDSPVDIRPFTMYLTPGKLSEDTLLKKTGSGVNITSLGGLHAGANPVSGDFSLQSAGFLIEGGKKTTAVKSFTVAGNFYDLLKNVTALASNLEFPGMGTFGSPSVLVEGLSIAGK